MSGYSYTDLHKHHLCNNYIVSFFVACLQSFFSWFDTFYSVNLTHITGVLTHFHLNYIALNMGVSHVVWNNQGVQVLGDNKFCFVHTPTPASVASSKVGTCLQTLTIDITCLIQH